VTDFNALLASSFADFIRRRFGEDIELSAIAPELIPVIALQDDRPEWGWLLGESLLGLGFIQTAFAAQNSAAQIRNPPGSGVLVMIDEVEASSSAPGELNLCVQQISAGNMTTIQGTNIGRDTRLQGNRGIAICSAQNNAAATNIVKYVNSGTAPWVWRNLGIVLAPGSAAQVLTTAVNTQLDVSFVWRERRVRPEELA
jgi:hypothetical protein